MIILVTEPRIQIPRIQLPSSSLGLVHVINNCYKSKL